MAKSSGETTAALQAMLQQQQQRLAQAEAGRSMEQAMLSSAERQASDNEGLANKALARRDTEQAGWQSWDTKANDFLSKRDTTSKERDQAQTEADRQRDENTTLEGARNARIAELRQRARGGGNATSADALPPPSPQEGGTYVSPVRVDPVVAVDPSLNAEQKDRASALVEAARRGSFS